LKAEQAAVVKRTAAAMHRVAVDDFMVVSPLPEETVDEPPVFAPRRSVTAT
jgi:hypothetical protein